MGLMLPQLKSIRLALPFSVALILVACGGAGPGWTYAPLGPSAAPTEAASGSPAPSGSGGGTTVMIEVHTTDAFPLAFDPQVLDAPADTDVRVSYANDSSLPHNIDFFDGTDQNSNSIAKTNIVTGPGATEVVTFHTPATPGDYFFWCDVHTTTMTGTLHVTPKT